MDAAKPAWLRAGTHARVRAPWQRVDTTTRRVADRAGHMARFVRRPRVSQSRVGDGVGLVLPRRSVGTPLDYSRRTRTASQWRTSCEWASCGDPVASTRGTDVACQRGVFLLWVDALDVPELAALVFPARAQAPARTIGALFVRGIRCGRGRRLSRRCAQ